MDEALRTEIDRFVRESPENRLPRSAAPYFDAPLVGVAAADDPLFDAYRRIIGPFHATPGGLLPGAASVVSWVLPITRATREGNRKETAFPSLAWAQTRSFGEELNSALRRHVVAWLADRGYAAVAPVLAPEWRRLDDPSVGLASTWSERHAAYAAGLGTFSLSDGFITVRGIAHRLGSVVTTLALSPTSAERPGVREYCTFYGGGSCTSCIPRCPAGAISREGHDKARCSAYLDRTIAAAVAEPWGTPIPGCGLCQTRVPCEGRIPLARARARAPRRARGAAGRGR